MTQFYADGQLRKVASMMGAAVPSWLLLGGPSDGNEAQTARQLWPGVRVLGVEPSRHAVDFQLFNGWPAGQVLLCAALADRCGPVLVQGISPTDHRHARLGDGGEEADGWTLDALDAVHGPFENALLWLDVEGSEALALRGAEGLLSRGAVRWATVETSTNLPEVTAEVEATLRRHGFAPVGDWKAWGPYKDTLWKAGGA